MKIFIIFCQFKEEFPEIHAKQETLGKEVHEKGGPLDEKSRWLIKIAIPVPATINVLSRSIFTKPRQTGINEDEIKHALLLLIPTTGFPAFMTSYAVLKSLE